MTTLFTTQTAANILDGITTTTTAAAATSNNDNADIMMGIPRAVFTGNLSSNANHTLMGNASLEETNPRLVNGVVNLLFMLFNIGGNGLVLYVYHSLFRNTVFNLFVKALASLDLVTACTTMLIDVIMKMRDNHEDQLNTEAMCKLSHFQVYANSMTSGCVLTLIAYQRYRKICHPLQRGMRHRQARILLVIISIVCLVLSIPTIFLYGPRHVKVQVRDTVVHATICRADENYQDSPLNMVFYYVLMAAFCFVLTSMVVLYFLVSRSIRNFEKRSSALFNPSSPTTPTPGSDNTINGAELYGHENGRHNLHHQQSPLTTRTIVTSPVHGRNPLNPNNPNPINDPFQTRRLHSHNAALGRTVQPHQHNHHHHSSNKRDRFSQARMSTFSIATSGNMISAQMYRVFSIITVVFIISYLPHLVALILTKVLKLDDQILTQGQRMALEFAYNCPYISTVSNPIIYGFSSSEFRDRVRELLENFDICCSCCCCCCCCCCDNGGGRGCRCCEAFDCCEECECCGD